MSPSRCPARDFRRKTGGISAIGAGVQFVSHSSAILGRDPIRKGRILQLLVSEKCQDLRARICGKLAALTLTNEALEFTNLARGKALLKKSDPDRIGRDRCAKRSRYRGGHITD